MMEANKKDRDLTVIRKLLFAGIALFIIYGSLRWIAVVLFNGDPVVGFGSLMSGIILSVLYLAFYFIFPHPVFFPLFVGFMGMFMLIFSGIYLQSLDFYFYILLLVVGLLTIMKNFKLLLFFVVGCFFVSFSLILFVAPHIYWLDAYRLFTQFTLFLFGSFFFLRQTYNVEMKDNKTDQAFLSFSSLLDNTPNYMIITDPQGRVQHISKTMLDLAHFMRREFAQNQPLLDLAHDKALKLMFADILDATGIYETVTAISIKGETRYFKIISNRMTGASGGRFIDISDVTDIEEARNFAEIANASKSNFLATMSHEIRTPMNAIIGIAQIQMQKANQPGEYKDALETIYSSGNNLLGIINDILDLSKIETGKLTLNLANYDVPSLINDAIQINIVRIGSKPIEFVLEINQNLPSVLYGDELRLKQILNNLLSNAIKYTNFGEVKLTVSHSVEENDIILHFIITDTGQGMTLADRDRLFSEYMRFNAEANRATEGTGLGLTITKKLVEMMDGIIWAETEFGKGSVFMVMVKQGKAGDEVIGEELMKQLCNFSFRGRRQFANIDIDHEYMPYGRVLIVDDVETNLYVAKGLMSPYGLTIETAESGFIALDNVNDGAVYDIIFMDHMMPKMDGIETTQKLRDAGYHHPIVALTANAVIGQSDVFLKSGFDGFISKPIDVRQLDSHLLTFIRDKKPAEVVEAARREKEGKQTNEATPNNKVDDELLKIFVRDAKKALPYITDTNDLKNYIVNVHAMKSALANIGEHDASRTAARLEEAGKNQQANQIKAETPKFLETLQAIITKNEPPTPGETTEDSTTDSDPELLHQQLEVIRVACEEYDDLAIETALAVLKGKPWSKETKALLDSIAENVLHSNFEEIAEGIT